MPPKTKKAVEYPTAKEIFDKPKAPAAPLPPAWEADSVARALADENIAKKIGAELGAIVDAPKPQAQPDKEKKKIYKVVENALSRIVSARSILNTQYPELRWAVKGIIPEGATFLAGPPKLGKSLLCINIAVAVAEGGKALSYFEVEQGAVLYLALEDGERRIQKRLKKLVAGEISDNLEVVTKWPRLNMGCIEAIETWIKRKSDARLIIVDTFKMLRPLRNGQNNNYQNSYDIDYEDVSPLTEFTVENNICLVIVTHTRKAFADDPLATVSGSFGLTGAADGVLVLSRARSSRMAKLTVIGRDVEEQELALEFSPDVYSWAVLGKANDVAARGERAEIIELLKNSDEPLSPSEIANLLDRNSGATRKILWRMKASGQIRDYGRKYHLPEFKKDGENKEPGGNGKQIPSDYYDYM